MAIMHKLYIGLNDKETKNQILSTEQAEAIIRLACIRMGLDYTIYKGNGIYTHESGMNTIEQVLILEFIEFQSPIVDIVKALANYLKGRLNQEAIGYAVIELKESELL